MSNTAMVVFANQNKTKFSSYIYLHWNSTPPNIAGYLLQLQKVGWHDYQYAAARFVQIVANIFDTFGKKPDNLSIGISPCPQNLTGLSKDENSDNGTYIVSWSREKRCIVVTRIIKQHIVLTNFTIENLCETFSEYEKTVFSYVEKAFDRYWNSKKLPNDN